MTQTYRKLEAKLSGIMCAFQNGVEKPIGMNADTIHEAHNAIEAQAAKIAELAAVLRAINRCDGNYFGTDQKTGLTFDTIVRSALANMEAH